jgi:hypothetical protein
MIGDVIVGIALRFTSNGVYTMERLAASAALANARLNEQTAAMAHASTPARAREPCVSVTVRVAVAARYFLITGDGDQLPSSIEGGVSLGQYIRKHRINFPAGAGSQLAWGTCAGCTCEKYKSSEPSALTFG